MENIEPKIEQESPPQEFAQKYQELCDKLGYRIVVSPTWTARDDGTFSTVLQYTIGQLPKKETNA